MAETRTKTCYRKQNKGSFSKLPFGIVRTSVGPIWKGGVTVLVDSSVDKNDLRFRLFSAKKGLTAVFSWLIPGDMGTENTKWEWWTAKATGARLDVSEDTLANWHRQGKGPPRYQFNGQQGPVRYRSDEVEAWALAQLSPVPAESDR